MARAPRARWHTECNRGVRVFVGLILGKRADGMGERVTLPVLPLRELVLFPGSTSPISVGRPGTLRAVERALKDEGRQILAGAQRANVDNVMPANLYTTRT